MKQVLFLAFIISSFHLQAQVKGTDALGFGIGIHSRESTGPNFNQTVRTSNYSLTYAHFIRDNSRLSITGSYMRYKSEHAGSASYSFANGYGGGATYQKYFPLIKKLFLYGGGGAMYNYSLDKYSQDGQIESSAKTNRYSLGASGGVAYFLSKRLAFEAQLLSANASYSISKGLQHFNSDNRDVDRSFSISSSGTINNLGFQIYFLF